MDEFQAMLIAGLTGFVSGILLCIPVGPINLVILNEALGVGFCGRS
jgi:arginine exporter protein ArgO